MNRGLAGRQGISFHMDREAKQGPCLEHKTKTFRQENYRTSLMTEIVHGMMDVATGVREEDIFISEHRWPTLSRKSCNLGVPN
jgi:hypothetical protein